MKIVQYEEVGSLNMCRISGLELEAKKDESRGSELGSMLSFSGFAVASIRTFEETRNLKVLSR